MRIARIDPNHVNGLVDKVLGLGKEIAGEVLDNDRLVTAGEAQQSNGTEKLTAIREQAEADILRTKAQANASKQLTAQRAKAS
jgi:uncharacterized protein YjbJ (UPF0337 family)